MSASQQIFTTSQALGAVWDMADKHRDDPEGGHCIVYQEEDQPNPLVVRSSELQLRAEGYQVLLGAEALPTGGLHSAEPVALQLARIMSGYIRYVDESVPDDEWVSAARLRACADPENIHDVLSNENWKLAPDVEWLRTLYLACIMARGSELRWSRRPTRGDYVELQLASNRVDAGCSIMVISRRPPLGYDRRTLHYLWLKRFEVAVALGNDQAQPLEGALAAAFAEVAWRVHMEALLADALEKGHHSMR